MDRFRAAASAAATRLGDAEGAVPTRTLTAIKVRTVVLVEGTSDRAALEALAARRGRDLDVERVCVVPIGGATNIRRFLAALGPHGIDVRLAGLCDTAEQGYFQRGLQAAGLATHASRAELAALGFQVCVEDLEDELIRCLGAASVQQVIEAHGDLPALLTFQRQPAQRGRAVEQQLRRFLGTISGRKLTYARAIVGAIDLADTPRPLDELLADI